MIAHDVDSLSKFYVPVAFKVISFTIFNLNYVEVYIIVSQEPKKANDVSFITLHRIVFELSACENSVELPAKNGCKANDLTRYKVDTGNAFYLIIEVMRIPCYIHCQC